TFIIRPAAHYGHPLSKPSLPHSSPVSMSPHDLPETISDKRYRIIRPSLSAPWSIAEPCLTSVGSETIFLISFHRWGPSHFTTTIACDLPANEASDESMTLKLVTPAIRAMRRNNTIDTKKPVPGPME